MVQALKGLIVALLILMVLRSGSLPGVSSNKAQGMSNAQLNTTDLSQLPDGKYVMQLEVRQGLYYNYLVIPSPTGERQQPVHITTPGLYSLSVTVKGGYLEVK